MKRQLLIVLAVVALFIKFWPGVGAGPPAAERPKALTVRGVRLGMTRAQVIQKLGPPLRESESELYRHFREAKYRDGQGFGDPDVVFDGQGRVVSVSGESLEWPGGAITDGAGFKGVGRTFTGLLELRAPIYHPYWPGAYYAEERNLMLYAESPGLFGSYKFCRAELTVPYLAFEAWPDKFKEPLLSSTARRILRPNRARLSGSEVIGCYQCCRVLKTAPVWPKDKGHPDWGVCPYCDEEMLIGGSFSEITSEFLVEMRRAWLRR